MIRPQCLVFGLLLLGVVQWTTVCSAEGFEEKTVSLDVNKMVMDALDLSTDPCSDFYQFACGGWLAAHANLSASADQDSKSFTTIAVHNNAILAAAVNDPKNSMLFEFNRACLDEDSINELGFGPASPDYQTASGVKDVSTFLSSAAELTLKGYTGILWGLGVAPNAMQPTVNVLQMTQGGVSLPYPALYTATDNETLALQQQYRTYISGLFQLVGVQTATSDDWAAQVFAFEQRVAEFTVPSTALFDPFVAYNNFTGPQLQALMPDVPLYAYFEVLLRSDEPSLAVLDAPSFFANMSSLLAAAPTASLMHYLQYKVLNSAAPLLSTPFQRLHFYFYSTVLEGVAEAPPRWETCLSLASAALPDLLGSAFVKAAFPPSAAQLASQMVSAIETAFTSDLQTVSWMDNQTRALALQKHAQLLTLVGGPANPANYSTVAIGKSFWDNVQACAGYQTSALVRAVGSQVDRSRWEMPAQTINAYYDPTLNDLVMIAGILQVPYFDPSGQFPLAMQFGGAGVIAGHESTHSMDSEGADYNGQGMLTDWWNPQTRANFEERVQCVIDQYSQYEVLPGVYVNGVLTQGENVADLGGVNNAFNALASVLGDELNDPSTVVPKFTNAQLFFVAYAQGWCTVQTPQLILELINTDPHSPPRYRVIGPLQDSEQFAQAFSCPVNSYMNPPNKCSVW